MKPSTRQALLILVAALAAGRAATLRSAEPAAGAVPAAPERLFAYADPNELAITLSWTDRADNELGYRVEKTFDPSIPWATAATLPANATSYRDTSIFFGETYYYRVWAINAAGTSAQASNETTATAKLANTALALDLVSPAGINANWDQDFGISFKAVDGSGVPVRRATVLIVDPFNSNSDQGRTDDTGRFQYLRRVPHGQTPGAYQFDFRVMKEGYSTSPTLSRTVQVNNPFAASGSPTIARQPHAVTATVGTSATLSVAAIGAASFANFPAYQWQRNGVSVAGATNADYTIANVSPTDAGNYQVVVRNTNGPVTSLEVALTVQPTAWLGNLSARATLANAQTLTVGFAIGGGLRDILVRAAGPALANFGLTTAMPDPRIDVFVGASRLTANNDWPLDLAPQFTELGAFPFAVPSRDAALRWTILGSQTVQVSGSPGGVVLVEAYDTGTGGPGRLVNLSARNRVGTGSDILIAGFFVNGTGTKRLLVRAVGPALGALGVSDPLADPVLEVRNGSGVIATNDNWDASLAATFAQVAAFPLTAGSRDAALVVTLNAGAGYTAQVSGVNNTTGEALIEIYELP